jgi:hypothetical protein
MMVGDVHGLVVLPPLGISIKEMEKRLRAGDAELLSIVLAPFAAYGGYQAMTGGEENPQQLGASPQVGLEVMQGPHVPPPAPVGAAHQLPVDLDHGPALALSDLAQLTLLICRGLLVRRDANVDGRSGFLA